MLFRPASARPIQVDRSHFIKYKEAMKFSSFALSAMLLSSIASVVSAKMSGFVQPTSASVHVSGTVFISEKGGGIKSALSINSTTATLVKMLSVVSDGDLGLTSLLATPDFLYVTYAARAVQDCIDNGANAASRLPATVLGCPSTGVLARFPISKIDGSFINASADPEVILPRTDSQRICAQFTGLGIDSVVSGPDGALYVSAGVGALDLLTGGADIGQYGGDPCGTGAAIGGHFRAQDPVSWAGKILRIDVGAEAGAIPVVTVYASGVHNPWRISWFAVAPASVSSLYVIDTSGYNSSTEELSVASAGVNLGWPCLVGAMTPTAFTKIGSSQCSNDAANFSQPLFTSVHPGTSGTFSALGFHKGTQRFVVADYTSARIFSFDASEAAATLQNSQSLTVDAIGSFAVHIFTVGEVLWAVDIVKGSMYPLAIGTGPKANPSSSSLVDGGVSLPLALGLGLGLGLGIPIVIAVIAILRTYFAKNKASSSRAIEIK
jgi:glucose/arabinose dehydrogenase